MLEVSPVEIDFGAVTVGGPPLVPTTVAVTNRGFGTLQIASTRLGGRDRCDQRDASHPNHDIPLTSITRDLALFGLTLRAPTGDGC